MTRSRTSLANTLLIFGICLSGWILVALIWRVLLWIVSLF